MMKKTFLLLLINLLIQSGNYAVAGQIPSQRKSAAVVAVAVNSERVNFKGVSFNYNPQIFGKVETQEVAEDSPLENASDKPGGNFPKHIAFHFQGTNSESRSTIKIIPIEDYRRMYAVSNDMTKAFDNGLADLRTMLKNKNFRRQGEVPFLPYMDAHQTVAAKIKHFSFDGGKGFFFLTQYDQDFANYVNNDDLIYIFQGITDDGKNYVLAEFQVIVSFLQGRETVYEKGFEGYRIPTVIESASGKEYKKYLSKITKRLETIPADKYDPNLKYFDEIISSLKIEK